jgi:hypothetical protein
MVTEGRWTPWQRRVRIDLGVDRRDHGDKVDIAQSKLHSWCEATNALAADALSAHLSVDVFLKLVFGPQAMMASSSFSSRWRW